MENPDLDVQIKEPPTGGQLGSNRLGVGVWRPFSHLQNYECSC